MRLFVPSWVVPGSYLENLRFLEDKPAISGVELLFFLYDGETRRLFEKEYDEIARFKDRFHYAAHLPEPLKAEHQELIDRLSPLVEHFIVHPGGSALFPDNRFVLENTRLEKFEDALEKLPPDKAVCMDTGHLLLEDQSPVDFLRRYGGRVKEIHLHGLDREKALLDGKLPDHRPVKQTDGWLQALLPELARFDGIINLEVFSWAEAAESLRHLPWRPLGTA
jgi:sugar phosphate isomerase/epimerase